MKDILANVGGYQVDNKTGLIVPGTKFEDHNLIYNDLLYYLPYKTGTNTVNQAMDNLFAASGTLSSGDNGYDGIAYGVSSTGLTHKLDTDLNTGGDLATAYVEFSGSIAGSINLSAYLYLGFNYTHASTAFADTYAQYDINQNVESGRTFYFYWRLTLS